jgi:hypothetical protein
MSTPPQVPAVEGLSPARRTRKWAVTRYRPFALRGTAPASLSVLGEGGASGSSQTTTIDVRFDL